MKIIADNTTQRKPMGSFKVVPTSLDDLWLLSELIIPGAHVTAKTTRKIKISETKVEKKVYVMTLVVEKCVYEYDLLRISGIVHSEHDDIPKGSAHSFSIQAHDMTTIEQEWLDFQKQKLHDATKEQLSILLVAMDRQSVFFAKLKQQGYDILSSFEGDVQKKAPGVSGSGSFYKDITTTLVEYDQRFSPTAIVLASPSFFKDDFLNQFQHDDIKKKIISATVSDVHEHAFDELLKRDEVKQAIQKQHADDSLSLVDDFFTHLSRDEKVAYGFSEVEEKAVAGSVDKLLISSHYFNTVRDSDASTGDTAVTLPDYELLKKLLTFVETSKGSVHIISSESEAGKKLDGIAGIGAILRY